MAIYHLSSKPISRSSGRSAVASAAYRCAVRLTNERDGLTHDFTRKQGVEHCEIVLPEGVSADWAKDRSALWNAAERAERQINSRVAREFEIALPHELSALARLEATREFAQHLANRYGVAVDFAIHAPHEKGDVRNIHAHVMTTTRAVTEDGLGGKTNLERKNSALLAEGIATTDMQLRDIRQSWEQIANRQLMREGLDIRIDHRSHSERGLEIEPTEHMGVHTTQMQRQGMEVERARLDEDAAKRNAELIREKPEQVLTLITAEKSVFDRHDIARTLHRYINDDAQAYQNAFASVMASPALVQLQAERKDQETGEVLKARYSTREMVDTESGMMQAAERLHQARNHGVDRRYVARAIARQDETIQKSSGDVSARLSDEQRQAIAYVTGPERIAAVFGFAGAGKSTMLAAAREAWEAQGYKVHGAALAGKAAEGLEESSNIQSRTLASWSRSWENNRETVGRGDVFVIDEAGMVGSRQLAHFIGEVEQRGAKIVLVGDHQQLQAISAGAPFRILAERLGHVELSEIRRQREGWQREASVAFATHRTAEGLAAYRDKGNISFSTTGDEARAAIVQDYLADREQRPDGTRVAMAHRRADVRAINDRIRSELQDRGELARARDGDGPEDQRGVGAPEPPKAFTYQTDGGRKDFAEGDRIVFLQNDRDLGVKNGMLGTVVTVEPNTIHVELDGAARSWEDTRIVSIPTNEYQAIDHGYATTIHKNQGATVDRAFVLASITMDQHLTYVAMTRHRDGVQLYAAKEEFTNAGRLVDHGAAPYENNPKARESYFVTLENDKGEQRTVWGVDLKRALQEASPQIGDRIGLQHEGATPVTLPDGTQTQRNSWRMVEGGELAYSQLEHRLSRSGAKETTLDYVRDFAERRGIASDPGIAEQFGVRSEIELAPAPKQRQDVFSRPAHPEREHQGRPSERQHVYEERAGTLAGPVRREDSTQEIGGDRQRQRPVEKPAPLVPAITRHDRSIEDVAREKAMSAIDHGFEAVESVARHVFRDPAEVAGRLRTVMTEKEGNGKVMAKAMAEGPERFGELRGKSGLFGDNKERKAALHYARVVASHIGYTSDRWELRLGEERKSEQWQREKRDVVEVPGLTQRSAEILDRVDKVSMNERHQLIDELRSTPDGHAALEEAKLIANALQQRFGHSDPRNFAKELELRPELAKQAEQIKSVARAVERTRMAELSRDHTLKQQLTRSQGLGLSR